MTAIDISQYHNRLDVMQDWIRQQSQLAAKLQRVDLMESSAQELLELSDAPEFEKRQARAVLAECAQKRAQLAERSTRAANAIANLKRELAQMQPEYERQKRVAQLSVLTTEGSRVGARGKVFGDGFRP